MSAPTEPAVTATAGPALSRWARPAAVAGAALWLAALTGYQLEAGGRLVVVPGLALAPLLVSLVLGWRGTGVVATCAITIVVVLSDRVGTLASSDAVLRVGGAAATSGFAVLNAAVRRHREQRLARVVQVADVAQAAILHAVPPELGGFRVATRYVSASQDARVGGDLFDAVDTARGVRVLVADVRGKGLPAVRVAAETLAAFRQLAGRPELRLVDVAEGLERAVAPGLGDEDFVTALLCELGPTGHLEVVNCGHPAPLHLPERGPARQLAASEPSPPLGLGVRPRGDRHRLGPGERLLLFTDGLSEARDSSGRFFDPAEHVAVLRSTGVSRALDQLLAAVTSHAGGRLHDDLAVVLIAPAEVATPPVTTAPHGSSLVPGQPRRRPSSAP